MIHVLLAAHHHAQHCGPLHGNCYTPDTQDFPGGVLAVLGVIFAALAFASGSGIAKEQQQRKRKGGK